MRNLTSLLLFVLAIVACGGSRQVGKSTSSGATNTKSEETAKPGKPIAVLHITLEMDHGTGTLPTTLVTVVETNETGANVRHNVGEFDGNCQDVTPEVRATDPQVFLAFHCKPVQGQRGVLVHLIHRRNQLVLLRAWLGTSKPAFDDFDQIGELPRFLIGVPLRTDYD